MARISLTEAWIQQSGEEGRPRRRRQRVAHDKNTKEEEEGIHCAPHTASPQTLNKYDSSDCIDIDRLQCGFSAHGK